MLTDPNVWSRIRRDIADAAPEGADIEAILGGRLKRGVLGRRAVRRPTEIAVENDVSALHTVVEIKADDRRGLLYTIARTFHELGLGIDLARITTHVDRVIDVFYIRDSDGQKISSKERLDVMKERLLEALE
jgi:[protein-PII] uridylyltransferase